MVLHRRQQGLYLGGITDFEEPSPSIKDCDIVSAYSLHQLARQRISLTYGCLRHLHHDLSSIASPSSTSERGISIASAECQENRGLPDPGVVTPTGPNKTPQKFCIQGLTALAKDKYTVLYAFDCGVTRLLQNAP